MTKLPYIKNSDSIIGYSESKLAKYENNDCVVRAIASAFDMSYDESHSLVSTMFNRKLRKGTDKFTTTMRSLSKSDTKFNNKTFSYVETSTIDAKQIGSMIIEVPKYTTVNQFVKKYTKGTFVVVVASHAFCIKDGVVMGNPEDSVKIKRRVISAFQVNEK
jgi:sulfate adenylyltransferase subunit 1 (EFTu-like GTPase family)